MLANRSLTTTNTGLLCFVLLSCGLSYCDEEWQSTVKHFLSLVEDGFDANSDVDVVILERNVRSFGFGLPYHEVKVNDLFEVLVATDGSTVYQYQRLGGQEDFTCLEKKREDAIDKSVAFSRIIPVLQFYNFPISEHLYRIEFFAPRIDRDSLADCSWHVEKDLDYNGTIYRSAMFLCSVSACTGNIEWVGCASVIAPDQGEAPVLTREDAISIASNHLNSEKSILHLEDIEVPEVIEDILYVIAPKLPYPHDPQSVLGLVFQEPQTTNYCWEVPFMHQKGNNRWRGVVWINAREGTISGISPAFHGPTDTVP